MTESQIDSSEGIKKPLSDTILYVIIGILVACIIVMGVGISNGKFCIKENSDDVVEEEGTEDLGDEEGQSTNGYVEVDAGTLGAQFLTNIDAAEERYLNKNAVVTGYFYDTGCFIKEREDTNCTEYALIVGDPNIDLEHRDEAYIPIRCYVSDNSKGIFQGYEKGDKILIEGKVLRYIPIDAVEIENCNTLARL